MKLSFFVILFSIAIILFSIPSVINTPFTLNTTTNTNMFFVSCQWNGVSNRIVDNQATSKLEQVLSGLTGLKYISSSTDNGNIKIKLEFKNDIEHGICRFNIAMAIRQIYHKLPNGISYPVINSHKTSGKSNDLLLRYIVLSDKQQCRIEEFLSHPVWNSIKQLEGVKNIEIKENSSKKIVLTLKEDTFVKSKKDIIVQAIKQYFDKRHIGKIAYISFNTDTIFAHASLLGKKIKITEIPLFESAGKIIYLKDVVHIQRANEVVSSYFRINGKKAYYLNIYANENANKIALSKTITNEIDRNTFKQQTFVDLGLIYNFGDEITDILYNFFARVTIVNVILLIVFYTLGYSLKHIFAFVIGFTINLALSFIVLSLFFTQFDEHFLLSIAISQSLIFSYFIVLTDHFTVFNDRKVLYVILTSVVTTLVALIMLEYNNDAFVQQSHVFAITLSVQLIIALLICYYILPYCGYSENSNTKHTEAKKHIVVLKNNWHLYYRFISFISKYKNKILIILLFAFGFPFFLLPQKIEKKIFFKEIYNSILGSKYTTEVIRPLAEQLTGGTLRLFYNKIKYIETQQQESDDEIYISAFLPDGSTLQQANEAIQRFEKSISNIGAIFRFKTQIKSTKNINLDITLKSRALGYRTYKQIIDLARRVKNVGWVIKYKEHNYFVNNTNNNVLQNYGIRLYGYNFKKLLSYATKVRRELLKSPFVNRVSIKGNSSLLAQIRNLNFDSEYFANHNINTTNIWNKIDRNNTNSVHIGSWIEKNKNLQVELRFNKSEAINQWLLNNSPVNVKQAIHKLAVLSNIKITDNEIEVYRENGQYILNLMFDYQDYTKPALNFLNNSLMQINNDLPLGYYAVDIFNIENIINENSLFLLFLAVLAIFFICAILFNSLKQAFAIILLIPVSYIGVFLCFELFSINVNYGAYIGLILVTGISVNSGILIIYHINYLLKTYKYENQNMVILLALKNKFRPVLLTVFSTSIGLCSFLFSEIATFWKTLSITTFAGIVVSLVGVFIYLPLFLFTNRNEINQL